MGFFGNDDCGIDWMMNVNNRLLLLLLWFTLGLFISRIDGKESFLLFMLVYQLHLFLIWRRLFLALGASWRCRGWKI